MRIIKSRTHKTPQQQCEIAHETWGPHAGCAEYMSRPEIHRCPSPSTHVVKMTGPYGREDDTRVCQAHSRDRDVIRDFDPFVKVRGIYRYRTV